jgi:C1A family cysteine protease
MARHKTILLWVAICCVFACASYASAGRVELPFREGDSLSTIREKIGNNGYKFTVARNWVYDMPEEQKKRFFSRHRGSTPLADAQSDDIGPLSERLGATLPSSFDWRNYNGRSYIGSIRNQGSCGSCYAFAAAAAAEGTYNRAMGLYDGNCVDFSESFIIWCLGKYGPYYAHFSGCDGADYDYQELEALTVEGVCLESSFPYTIIDPGSCTHWGDPRTVFSSWHRIACNDIDAIKTAIMTYGVVDAAVYAGIAFQAYSSGVYSDTNTSCSSYPCYYTATNHAISLVGWDDNPPEGGGGCWILRNSWGETWGEGGYMRIRYSAARVACEACYLTYPGVTPTSTPSPTRTPTATPTVTPTEISPTSTPTATPPAPSPTPTGTFTETPTETPTEMSPTSTPTATAPAPTVTPTCAQPVITNVVRDDVSGDVIITWSSQAGAEYDVYYADELTGAYTDVADVTAVGTSVSWRDDGSQTGSHPSTADERYYKIACHGASDYAEYIVGMYKLTMGCDPLRRAYTAAALPLIPYSDEINDVIGDQGHSSPLRGFADKIWKFNPSTWSFDSYAWNHDGVWEAYPEGAPTALDPDTCYAFLYQNSEYDKSQEIFVVGRAARGDECHNRISGIGSATYRYSLAGYGYLGSESLDASHLVEDGFTGNALRGLSDKLFPFDFSMQSFGGYAWHNGAAWQYYNVGVFELEPGEAYLIYNRNSVDDWIWTATNPVGY